MPKLTKKTTKKVVKKTPTKKVKAKAKKKPTIKGNGLLHKHKRTEKTHQVVVPGLPEGWKAVAYRLPKNGEHFLLPSQNGRADFAVVMKAEKDHSVLTQLIVEKE